MPEPGTLLWSATVVLASWLVCGLSYASVPPEQGGLIALSVWAAASATLAAAVVLVAGWRGKVSSAAVRGFCVFAAVAILWLALLLQLGNH